MYSTTYYLQKEKLLIKLIRIYSTIYYMLIIFNIMEQGIIFEHSLLKSRKTINILD